MCLLPSSPSSLFPDVVNCMQTDNLELKKLVYLYLMNYAKSQPDMAIMAVNSFVKVGTSKKQKWFIWVLTRVSAGVRLHVCLAVTAAANQNPQLFDVGIISFPSRIVRTPTP